MLKAHALYLALIVSLVVTLLCGSFIFVGYFYRSQTDKSFIRLQLAANVQSGINYLIAKNHAIPLNTPTPLDIYGDGKDSVLLERRSWGIFQIGLSMAKKGKDKIKKAFLFGGEPSDYCLYLADQGRPLSLCGRTVLKGNVTAPKAGLKRARVEGQYFVGEKLVWGKITESSPNLPKLNEEVLTEVLGKLKTINAEKKEWPDSISFLTNSFFDYLQIIRLESGVFNGKVKGHVILASEKPIIIGSAAKISDAIIVAPGIIIKRGFKGSLQCLAKDSILVEENAELRYPSALGVIKIESSTQQPFIKLLQGSKLMGSIFSIAQKKDRFKTKISIGKQSTLIGSVYADGFLEIKGEIKGGAICSSILLVTPSSVYENYMLNATIDRYALPQIFAGSLLTTSNFSKKTVKWLY